MFPTIHGVVSQGGTAGGDQPAAATLLTWLEAPPLVEYGAAGSATVSWKAFGRPSGVPAGSPGIYAVAGEGSGTNGNDAGFRALGSAHIPHFMRSGGGTVESRYPLAWKVDTNGEYEAYADFRRTRRWHVVAAFNPDAVHLFTDPIVLTSSPGSTFADHDITTYVQGADPCLAAIIEIRTSSNIGVSVRRKGWTIDPEGAVEGMGFAVVPVDDDHVFQFRAASSTVSVYLLGYVKAGITPSASNPSVETLSSTNTYQTLAALPMGAEGAVYWGGRPSSTTNADVNIRPKGSTVAPFEKQARAFGRNAFCALVRGGEDNEIEAAVSNTNFVWYRFATIDAPSS